jgi:hypothetical protein
VQGMLPQPSHSQQPFSCHVCHFPALDDRGLLHHLSSSLHCSTLGLLVPSIGTLTEDQSFPMDVDNETDFFSDNCLVDDDTPFNQDASQESDSDGHDDLPDVFPRARAFSNMIDWSSSSEDDTDDDLHEDEIEDVTTNDDKY